MDTLRSTLEYAFGSTRAGSTDGVCEEAWVCTDPNEHVLNDYRCTCPQAVCGLDPVFGTSGTPDAVWPPVCNSGL